VAFTSFVVGPTGTMARSPLVWDFCTAARPLTDDNVVSDACLGSSLLLSAGSGPAVTATTPSMGCSTFGPDTSASDLRPADPDSTGGYYQPLRVDLAGTDSVFTLVRIHCDLANASASVARAFAAAYTMNQNPTLLPLTATIGGAPVTLSAIAAGVRVTFTASWPAASAETFAYVDPTTDELTMQRESMQVAWYSTAGVLDTQSTGRASDDTATTSNDGWAAPSTPGPVAIFVVLRDSRGGVDFAAYDVVVNP
jgi:hypothetical protein